jgi:hypothetical protein
MKTMLISLFDFILKNPQTILVGWGILHILFWNRLEGVVLIVVGIILHLLFGGWKKQPYNKEP